MTNQPLPYASPVVLLAPLTGRIVPLADVPDPVFSSGMLGDGIGIDPAEGRLVAPCGGTISQLAGTGHALTLTTHQGAQLLLHIGIDTVELGGAGFRALVSEGAQVEAGDLLVEFDLATVARKARSPVSVIAIANGEAFHIAQRAEGMAAAGRTPLLVLRPAAGTASSPAAASVACSAPGAQVRRIVKLTTPGGLHARPAARARAAARGLDAQVEVRFGDKRASLDSVVALLGLGAGEQAVVELAGIGPQATLAVEAVEHELTRAAEGETAPAAPSVTVSRADGVSPLAANTLTGVCAAPGIGVGTLVHLDEGEIDLPEFSTTTPVDELHRLDQALAAADAALGATIRNALQRGADAEAGIFAVHRVLLDDPTLIDAARDLIALGKSGGYAWRTAIHTQIAILAGLDDQLLAARATDLRDVEKRVLRALGHGPDVHSILPDDAVVAAGEFTPSDLAALDRKRIVALVMARGGATSHAAIIARQLGIPAIVAVGDALHAIPANTQVVVDATSGRIDHAPGTRIIEQARLERQRLLSVREASRKLSGEPAATRDGHQIEVAANIATLDDARSAVDNGADAVGLLRTELLFMQHQLAPGITAQCESYQAIVDALQGRRAIIRTLDAGADKAVDYLALPPEQNPALGLRGIRLAQVRPELLDDQLQGLLRVRPFGAVRIMLPMVTELAELVRIRRRIDEFAQAMGRTDAIEVGVMIEVPSAALLADQLARHADFLSIGTNDLTQYTLAMDRCHAGLAAQSDGLHPAVLRLIDATVRGARMHGKWVGVCGALASDPDAVPVLIGLGVTELSVEPVCVPDVKVRVRDLDYTQCRQRVQELLCLESAPLVRAASREAWPQLARTNQAPWSR
ncbi:MAG TPA: phosphoenolpyruvate--protein phosphotransferase [Pseudoduganella sp.]|jgi:phosphocarrier protein FPr